jgi:predicted pyridoxine 5'-phosphate oxidase superfamily flavin-nucleotide-binding protein
MHLRDANNAGNTASQTAKQRGFLYAVNANAKRIKSAHYYRALGKAPSRCMKMPEQLQLVECDVTVFIK